MSTIELLVFGLAVGANLCAAVCCLRQEKKYTKAIRENAKIRHKALADVLKAQRLHRQMQLAQDRLAEQNKEVGGSDHKGSLPNEEVGEPTEVPELQCCVCFDNRSKTVLFPCLHANLCVSCARQVALCEKKQCPTCRTPIARVIRTFS